MHKVNLSAIWTVIRESKTLIRLHNNHNFLAIQDGHSCVIQYVSEQYNSTAKQQNTCNYYNEHHTYLTMLSVCNVTQFEHEHAGPETLFTVSEVGASYIRLTSKTHPECILGSNATGTILPAKHTKKDQTSQFVMKVTVSATQCT